MRFRFMKAIVWRLAMLLLATVTAFPVTAQNSSTVQTNEARSLVLVIGAAGELEYGEAFARSADLWTEAARQGGFRTVVIGQGTNSVADDKVQLLTTITNEIAASGGELWVVLIGHGTFDGKTAKFNLRGPDISSDELAAALKNCRRPLAVINCASASGPFLKALSGPGRVVITATRSGYELNLTRFGDYLAKAIGSPEADLDKDGQTSLLEAYLMASRQVEQFYTEAGRLATEHSLMDDNGDGLGTPAEFFVGVRATKKAEGGRSTDGVRAHQMNVIRGTEEAQLSPERRAQRDALESELNALRERKTSMAEDDYYRELERVLEAIARIYLQPET